MLRFDSVLLRVRWLAAQKLTVTNINVVPNKTTVYWNRVTFTELPANTKLNITDVCYHKPRYNWQLGNALRFMSSTAINRRYRTKGLVSTRKVMSSLFCCAQQHNRRFAYQGKLTSCIMVDYMFDLKLLTLEHSEFKTH